MFDVSLGELLLVLIIGLIVLGPKRLPEAIKTVAGWIRALRRISASVQLELSKELKLQELQDSLKKAEQSGLKDISPEIQASIDELKRVTDSIQKEFSEASNEIQSNANDINENSHYQDSHDSKSAKVSSLEDNKTDSQIITGKDDNDRR